MGIIVMTGRLQIISLSALMCCYTVFIASCGGARPTNTPPEVDPSTSCDTIISAPFDNEIAEPVQLAMGCYRIEESVSIVEGGSLTIRPNTILQFDAETSITVHGGILLAQGTQDEPILFTGRVENPGYWGGIYIHHSGDLPVTLQNTIIRYAGGKDFLESSFV